MNKKHGINYEGMAQDLMVAGNLNMKRYGVEFRSKKGIEDVKNAMTKAKKNGMQKTEHEIGMCAIYLESIFKAAK